jgi:epoxyqueuosine reductase
VFIGEIILDLELDYNTTPESDFCGSCSLCIDACPTNAILPGRTLDAQKCISYQTIEKKEDIDEEIKPALMNRMFGCDICQDVCPWNRKAVLHTVPEFNPSDELMQMSKEDWALLEKNEHKRLFKSSAVKRARFEKLKRNIEIIL